MTFSFADLFSGIGGFHAAFKPLGGYAAFFSDTDAEASKVYRLNWGNSTAIENFGDIRTFTENKVSIPSFEVLTGGFPCQPFSKSGRQLGVREARGTLFYNILLLIEKKKPQIILLENVRNLIGPKHRSDYSTMVRLIRDMGYAISEVPTILSPHQIPIEFGGTPQHRERVFLAAYKTNSRDAKESKGAPPIFDKDPFGIRPEKYWNIENFLDSRMSYFETSRNLEMTDIQLSVLECWEDFLKQQRKMNKKNPPGFPLWSDYWTERSDFVIPKETPDWKKQFILSNYSFYVNNKKWIDSWKKRHAVSKFHSSNRKFEWQAGNASSISKCLIQFRPSGVRVKVPNYVPSFVAITQTPFMGWKLRSLSVSEAALLQGFGNEFDFGNQSERTSLKQIGNAVHSAVARLVFLGLLKRAVINRQEWASDISHEIDFSNLIPGNESYVLF